jgi:uncharacterized delta-60 repeat protein
MSIAIVLALMTVTVALAASGDLDNTFSGDGKIVQSFGGAQHKGRGIAVQSDGKIVVIGEKVLNDDSHDFAIARYNTNGSLDTTFSMDGRQVVAIGVVDQALNVAIQTDGKIVVGGQTCALGGGCDVALIRLNTDGALDKTFDGDGKVTTDVGLADNGGFDLVMLGNKIVVAGYMHDGTSYNAAVYRYNTNGSLDTTFSGDGILTIDFGMDDLIVKAAVYAGKIYVAGKTGPSESVSGDFIIARVNSDGSLDTTFSGDGKVITDLGGADEVGGMVVSGGKVIVVGCSDNYFAIVQYTASGALDPAFSGDGKMKAKFGYPSPRLFAVTIQSGKIIVVGGSDGTGGDAFLARYTADGNLDSTFGEGGIITTDWGGGDVYRAVAFKDSRIYVVGHSNVAGTLRFIVAAYLP